MALIKLTLNQGQPSAKVVQSIGTAIGSGPGVEINIDTGAGVFRQNEVTALIEQITVAILGNKIL